MNTDNSQELACKELVEIITDYIEGALPEAERRRFEQHLEACRGCRNYVQQMRLTIRTLGRLGPERLSSAEQERLLTTFRNWKARR
jgi:anti-sigma factor RsiW